MATTTATKIGFVGLGHMGGNVAARLLAAGYTVYGESRDRQEAQELVHEGLAWRDTPRDAALPASSPSTSAAMRSFFGAVGWPASCHTFRCVNAHLNALHRVQSLSARA